MEEHRAFNDGRHTSNPENLNLLPGAIRYNGLAHPLCLIRAGLNLFLADACRRDQAA
jgi:hypothetical protein